MMATWADVVAAEAADQGIDPAWAVAVMNQESSGNPNATGAPTPYGRAGGLMQLIPPTAQALGVQNVYDPVANAAAGVKLLKQNLAASNGDMAKATAAYYAGFHNTYNADVHRYVSQVNDKYQALQPQYPLPQASGGPTNMAATTQPQDGPDFGAIIQSKNWDAPASGSGEGPDFGAIMQQKGWVDTPPSTQEKPKTIAGAPDLTKTPSLLNDFGVGLKDVVSPIANAAESGAAWLANKAGLPGVAGAIQANQAGNAAQSQSDQAMAEPGLGGSLARGAGQIVASAPILMGGAEAAGAGLTAAGLPTVAGLVTGSGGAGVLGRGAALATSGALQGAGFNALTDRPVLPGAVAGAIGAPLLGAAGSMIGAGANAVGNMLRAPEGVATNNLLRAMRLDGLTPDQVIAKTASMGPNAVLADAGGPNMLRLADNAVIKGGTAAQTAQDVLGTRAAERGSRVVGAVQNATGQNGAIYDTIDGLIAQRSAEAGPLYDALKTIQPTEKQLAPLLPFIQSPRGQAALKDGLQILSDNALKNGQAFDPASIGLVKAADGTLMPAPGAQSFPVVQAVKEGLDDMVEGSRDLVSGKLPNTKSMNAVAGVRDAFTQAAKQSFPEYGAALQQWAGPSAARDAVLMGRRALNNDPEVTASIIQGMPDSQKEFFRQGVARALMDKVEANPSASVASILRNGVLQKKIAAGFGNDAAFQTFIDTIEQERRMMTTEAIGKGSQTAPRAMFDDTMNGPLPHALAAGRELLSGNVGRAGMSAIRAVQAARGGASPVTEETANMLLTPGNSAQIANRLMPTLTPGQLALAKAGSAANALTGGIGKGIQYYGLPSMAQRNGQ